MQGAAKAQNDYMADFDNNDCYKYAAYRNILNRKGKSVELLVSYDPSFTMMAEWYKQLFGESEGKDNKGIFPSAVTFSTDLHSMGQFIQDGSRIMFETVKNAGLGVKASGGVRDKEIALAMIEAGATRIGTSSGVKICS